MRAHKHFTSECLSGVTLTVKAPRLGYKQGEVNTEYRDMAPELHVCQKKTQNMSDLDQEVGIQFHI